jgi:hypothetical protein
MSAAGVEKLVWVLIYGGLIVVGLGAAVLRSDRDGLGWSLVLGGGTAATVGVLLIWVRSRMKDDA